MVVAAGGVRSGGGMALTDFAIVEGGLEEVTRVSALQMQWCCMMDLRIATGVFAKGSEKCLSRCGKAQALSHSSI